MVATSVEVPVPIVRWRYFGYAAVALAVMAAAIVSHNLWFLNFIHVFSGLLWTGIDLFMGFVLGPILRRVDFSARREIALRLTPRTLCLMPTISVITATSGWFLAVDLGYADLPWPQFGWVAAALALVTAMTIVGIGYLLPVNVKVCLELRRSPPDPARVGHLMRGYFYAIAAQGLMQLLTVVIMTRFRVGL